MNAPAIVEPDPLDALAAKIDLHHQGATVAFSKGIEHILKAGEHLIEAKKLVGHGNWYPWLEANTSVSKRMSQYYVRLTRAHAKLPAEKAKRVSHLSLRDAIRAISSDTSRAASLPPKLLDQAASDAEGDGCLKTSITNAKDQEKSEESWLKQNQVNADEGRDLITVREPSESERSLARALLRVIAEMAQQDPNIQPHTVKTVFDLISSGIEELWPYHPSEWEIGDGPPTIEPVPTDPAPTVEQQDPDDPVADDDPLAIPECFRREKTA
jgi:hypothetical protein